MAIDVQLRLAYRKFKNALRPFLDQDPTTTPRAVSRAIRRRAELLELLALPTTRHNVDRLVQHAAHALSLAAYLRDVDRPLPLAVRRDESLFLVALAAHCHLRGAVTAHDRCYDAEALLSLPHDGRSSPIVGAFLANALSWADLQLWSLHGAAAA